MRVDSPRLFVSHGVTLNPDVGGTDSFVCAFSITTVSDGHPQVSFLQYPVTKSSGAPCLTGGHGFLCTAVSDPGTLCLRSKSEDTSLHTKTHKYIAPFSVRRGFVVS